MWFEFSSEISSEIHEDEMNMVPIRYYDVKAGYETIFNMCQGDLFIICNAMADYADLLEKSIEERSDTIDEVSRFMYDYHAKRCRKIFRKMEQALGYDREKAIEKCRKKQGEGNDDVGEEALTLMYKKSSSKKEDKE